MSFNDFVLQYNLKNQATSNIKFYQVLSLFFLKKVGIHLGDGPFSSDIAFFKLHPSEVKHWVVYLNENCFDSSGCSPRQKLYKFIVKRNGHCLYFEHKIQGLTKKMRFLLCKFLFIY